MATNRRTYEQTHPWITFRARLNNAPPQLWMLLGEATSKCEHIAGVPLRPNVEQELHRLYLAKGVLATTAIEGNTLSESEVLQHLDGKLELPPSKEYLKQEIDNIVLACTTLLQQLQEGREELTPERICEFNSWVLHKLELDNGVIPGQIRAHSVVVGGVYKGCPPEDCVQLLQKLCDWLAGPEFQLPGHEIAIAILKAIIAHVYLAWIHPFGDGNGRTARLVEFFILLSAGVPTPAAHLLSNYYNQTRAKYYQHLQHASRLKGDLIPFNEYAIRGFVEGLREQLKTIREQQWDVAWRSYVYTQFRDKTSDSEKRQRDLLLDLSEKTEPVALNEITNISPRLARRYAELSVKTLRRDLMALKNMGLINENDSGYRAKREKILAFLPWRRTLKM